MKKNRLKEIQNRLNYHQFNFNKNMENLNFPILITNKNKRNQFLGRSPYNQTVYINQENLPFEGSDENLIGSILNVKIIKSNQNSLLGAYFRNA